MTKRKKKLFFKKKTTKQENKIDKTKQGETKQGETKPGEKEKQHFKNWAERVVGNPIGYLDVRVYKARGLKGGSLPFLVLSVCRAGKWNKLIKTKAKKATSDPKWNLKFRFNVFDLYNEALEVRVMHKKLGTSAFLGQRQWLSLAYFESSYDETKVNPWYPLLDKDGKPFEGDIRLKFKYISLDKRNITGPTNFERKGGIEVKSTGEYIVKSLPPEYVELFKKAGIQPKDLQDPETMNLIFGLIDTSLTPPPLPPVDQTTQPEEEMVSQEINPKPTPPQRPRGRPTPPPRLNTNDSEPPQDSPPPLPPQTGNNTNPPRNSPPPLPKNPPKINLQNDFDDPQPGPPKDLPPLPPPKGNNTNPPRDSPPPIPRDPPPPLPSKNFNQDNDYEDQQNSEPPNDLPPLPPQQETNTNPPRDSPPPLPPNNRPPLPPQGGNNSPPPLPKKPSENQNIGQSQDLLEQIRQGKSLKPVEALPALDQLSSEQSNSLAGILSKAMQNRRDHINEDVDDDIEETDWDDD